MQEREHGKWVGYYANECQTDVRQSAQVCGYLMSFARTLGEGPHYYEWMREFGDPEDEAPHHADPEHRAPTPAMTTSGC